MALNRAARDPELIIFLTISIITINGIKIPEVPFGKTHFQNG